MTLPETQQQHLAMELADALYEAEVRFGALGELRKAFEYFRITYRREQALAASDQALKPNSRQRLLAMLDQRQQPRQPFHQTKNTAEHYGLINRTLREFLEEHPKLDGQDFLIILGWAVRLAQYRDRAQGPALSLDLPKEPRRPEPARTSAPPKAGNDRDGTVSGRQSGRWLVELEGGFVVRATLAKGVREPDRGRRVSVRIRQADAAGQDIAGEIRRVY